MLISENPPVGHYSETFSCDVLGTPPQYGDSLNSP